jgi:hypothetical protein
VRQQSQKFRGCTPRKRTGIVIDTADAGEELLRLDTNPGKHRIRHRRGDIFGKTHDL